MTRMTVTPTTIQASESWRLHHRGCRCDGGWTLCSIWNLGTPWYHIGCNDLLTTTHDIIVLWYHMPMISWFGDFWFHGYDIICWRVWFHSHEIIIWFQGIITSYMISWVWISVLISWFFINEIISWFHVIMSWFDFNALHPVWCHSFDVIIWCHRLCIWFQCITSCMMS